MAATFVAEYETSGYDTNPASRAVSVTTADQDTLIVYCLASNGGGTYTIAGGSLDWVELAYLHISTSWGDVWVWTAKATAAATFNVTVTKTGGSPVYGFSVLRFSGAGGIGSVAYDVVNSAGAATVRIGVLANSVIVVAAVDWDLVAGTPTWLTADAGALTETTYQLTAFDAVFGGYHADAGAAGEKQVGLSAPTGQKFSIVAIEVLASALVQAEDTKHDSALPTMLNYGRAD